MPAVVIPAVIATAGSIGTSLITGAGISLFAVATKFAGSAQLGCLCEPVRASSVEGKQ